MGGTHYSGQIYSAGVPLLGQGGAPLGGKHLFVQPSVGSDGNSGDADSPLDTLTQAKTLATTGKNDVVHIVGDGGTTGTARIDAAFTWDLNATHIVGEAAPTPMGTRARIAPTGTTTAFANFITVSGHGNLFSNLEIWHGFNTGTTSAIALTISGNRNAFIGCHIVGMGDDASAQNAGSRCIKITGQYNYFKNCVIGTDDVTRTQANASVEFASGAKHNVFEDCIFVAYGSAATPVFIKAAAAGAMDRLNYFKNCIFATAGTLSGGVALAAVATLATASGGGLFLKDCVRLNVTDWGTDAASLAQMYVTGVPAGAQGAAGTILGDDIGRCTVAVAS